MNDQPKQSGVKRWRWRKWGTVALLVYLSGWILLWTLAKADVLPHNEKLGVIFYVVYFPLILVAESVLRVRAHI